MMEKRKFTLFYHHHNKYILNVFSLQADFGIQVNLDGTTLQDYENPALKVFLIISISSYIYFVFDCISCMIKKIFTCSMNRKYFPLLHLNFTNLAQLYSRYIILNYFYERTFSCQMYSECFSSQADVAVQCNFQNRIQDSVIWSLNYEVNILAYRMYT